MDKPPAANCFVGIDVSKGRVDVHMHRDATVVACTTDPEGLADLVNRLAPLQPQLVTMEAGGGYEGVIAAALAEAGLPVAITSGPQIRRCHRQTRQDRRDRRRGNRAFRRCHPPRAQTDA